MAKEIKCWTVQDSKFLDQPGERLLCKSEFVERNFRISYEWMKKAYQKIKRQPMAGYPIWLWEKAPKDSEKKRHEIVASLFADVQYSTPKILIDLKIPSKILLPSLYSRWNILLDYSIAFQRGPRQFRDWEGVFDISKRKSWDHVQYAVPFIMKEWIEATAELNLEKVKQVFQQAPHKEPKN